MGQPPLISEGSFTTKLPADVDEEKFNPSSTTVPAPPAEDGESVPTYLVLKCRYEACCWIPHPDTDLHCRLAQLLKGVKKQVAKDALSEEVVVEGSLDQASLCEAEITTWMSDLPAAFKLDTELDVAHPLSTCATTSPFLLAQRCELVIAANRTVLKLYLPFMKESGLPPSSKPSHQAVMGTINAAHAIIYASRVLHSLWRDTRPAAFDFYDFGRSLFDAAVLCAHAVIQQPKSIIAGEAMKAVTGALEVMRAVDSMKTGADPSRAPSEAAKIVELMKEKAERARSPDAPSAGMKRKRHDSSTRREAPFAGGFQLPFVGPSVSSTRPEQSRPAPLAMSKIASSSGKKDSSCSPPEAKSMKSSSKEKEKEKTPKYPSVGVRVRSPQGSPTSQSTSMASPQVPSSSNGLNASSRSSASTPDRPTQASMMGCQVSVMYPYPPSQPAPPTHPPQPDMTSSSLSHDFRMDFSTSSTAADDTTMDNRRYQSTFSNSSSTSTYDAPAPPPTPYDNAPHSNSTYRQPPTQEYYLQSYASVPPSYDQSGMPQPQNISVPPYGVHSPLDTAVPSGALNPSIPSTPRGPYHMLSEKPLPHYDHQVGKSELERQMSHEYQQTATSHGMSITTTPLSTPYVQGWQPEMPRQNNVWDYKYYNHQA